MFQFLEGREQLLHTLELVMGLYLVAYFYVEKKLSDAFANYHQDMNANVFENWFLEKLIPNLPEKSVVILDNASYQCRQVDKIPNMNTKKAEMLDFMKRNSITVPEPLPTKPVLLEQIKMASIQKKFAIDTIVWV